MLAASGDVSTAYAAVGPDTVAKILMTSGSTSHPKGVLTTHKMMCTNQVQLQDALPFLTAKPPRLVDWLPWNHVFGGSHNFNLVLANGGYDPAHYSGFAFGMGVDRLTMAKYGIKDIRARRHVDFLVIR